MIIVDIQHRISTVWLPSVVMKSPAILLRRIILLSFSLFPVFFFLHRFRGFSLPGAGGAGEGTASR